MIKEKTLLSTATVLLVLSFCMPLVVLPSSFIFPFIVPKILLFRSLVVGLVAVYALLLMINWERYRPRLTALNIAVFGFWLSFAVSTVVGVDWYRSFWDNHERMLGLFTVTHYVLLYYVWVAVVSDGRHAQTLIRWFLGAGSVVMAIALLQKIDPELLLNRGSVRVSSTLGNPIYVSGYGLFLLCFAALSYVHTAVTDRAGRYLAMTAGVLGFLGIFLGGTRGTLLGLIAACTVLLVSFGIFTSEKKYRLGVVGIFLLGLVVACGVWVARDTSLVQSITPVARLIHIDFANLEYNTRVMAWGIAWDSFLERPVFGWGPNNYYYAFNEYYRPEFLRYGYGETWFDNAHNIVMNTLSTQGAFGLVTYLAIFVVVGVVLLRARRAERISSTECALLLAFFVGHFVHNVFVFENPTSYLYFFVALGYVSLRTLPQRDVPLTTKTVSTPAAVSAGVIALLVVYVFNLNPAQANTATLQAIQGLYQGQGVAAMRTVSSVPTPHIDDVRNDMARTVSQLVPQLVEAGRQDQAIDLLALAITEVEKNLALHPMDIRVHLMLAQLNQQRAVLEQEGTYLAAALQLLEQARSYSPRRQQLLFTLAGMYTMIGSTTTSEALIIEARDLDPVVGEGWVQLVRHYQLQQDIGQITEVIQRMNTANIRLTRDQKNFFTNVQAEYNLQ